MVTNCQKINKHFQLLVIVVYCKYELNWPLSSNVLVAGVDSRSDDGLLFSEKENVQNKLSQPKKRIY